MAIIDVYQDTGPVSSGHGTTRISVANIGWKNSGNDETNNFVLYPIVRPETPDLLNFAYTNYTYMKISGTYPTGTRPRIQISGSVIGAPPSGYVGTGKVKLYYKLTNTYAVPTNNLDGGMIYLPPGTTQIIYPRLGTTGPETATSYLKHMTANTTYYSEYLVTQLFVEQGADQEYGNIGQIKIKFFMDEYESADV